MSEWKQILKKKNHLLPQTALLECHFHPALQNQSPRVSHLPSTLFQRWHPPPHHLASPGWSSPLPSSLSRPSQHAQSSPHYQFLSRTSGCWGGRQLWYQALEDWVCFRAKGLTDPFCGSKARERGWSRSSSRITLWASDSTVFLLNLMATIWLFTPSIQYRFLPSQSTATESARIPVGVAPWRGIRSPTPLHMQAEPTFNQSSCGLMVQWGPPDAVGFHGDPEDPLLLPVVVQREYCLLGSGRQDVKAAAAQAQQKQVSLDWCQQQGFAWWSQSQQLTLEHEYSI